MIEVLFSVGELSTLLLRNRLVLSDEFGELSRLICDPLFHRVAQSFIGRNTEVSVYQSVFVIGNSELRNIHLKYLALPQSIQNPA